MGRKWVDEDVTEPMEADTHTHADVLQTQVWGLVAMATPLPALHTRAYACVVTHEFTQASPITACNCGNHPSLCVYFPCFLFL
eukprot:m.1094817 g.1094817  ORF g.1094817 m.1094817 type:complete len:83 (-) comp24303_c1_seq6:819-1067(-)